MAAPRSTRAPSIFTIGHSTRAFPDFLAVLAAYDIKAIADVRTIPKSAHNPQFCDSFLRVELPKAGIEYLPFKSLGGLRHPKKDSPNTGWRNASFRGYADYMQTPQFPAALEELMAAARKKSTAIMCAEAVPWRCHRSLISDALLVRGWSVIDIFDERKTSPHELTSFARVEGLTIAYPGEAETQPGLFT